MQNRFFQFAADLIARVNADRQFQEILTKASRLEPPRVESAESAQGLTQFGGSRSSAVAYPVTHENLLFFEGCIAERSRDRRERTRVLARKLSRCPLTVPGPAPGLFSEQPLMRRGAPYGA